MAIYPAVGAGLCQAGTFSIMIPTLYFHTYIQLAWECGLNENINGLHGKTLPNPTVLRT
jgi:TM2 domain-containing membrane protein YozV